MDIEKTLFPDSGKLIKSKDGRHHATIVDIELDPFEVDFRDGDCAQIDVSKMRYIVLNKANLKQLITLIDEFILAINEDFEEE